jgi:hypothetical protein
LGDASQTWNWFKLPGISPVPGLVGPFLALNRALLVVLGSTSLIADLQPTLYTIDLDNPIPRMTTAMAASGSDISLAKAGQRNMIDVTVLTAFGNPAEPGASLSLELVGPERVRGQMLSLPVDSGVYRFIYVADTTGNYEMRITIFGQHISGSPLKTEIVYGSTDIGQSFLDITPLSPPCLQCLPATRFPTADGVVTMLPC